MHSYIKVCIRQSQSHVPPLSLEVGFVLSGLCQHVAVTHCLVCMLSGISAFAAARSVCVG